MVTNTPPKMEENHILREAGQVQSLLAQFYKNKVRAAYMDSLALYERDENILAALDVLRDNLLLKPLGASDDTQVSGPKNFSDLMSNLLCQAEWTPEDDGFDLGGVNWT